VLSSYDSRNSTWSAPLKQNIPLNAQCIAKRLESHHFTTPYKLHLFDTIDSTNTYLKNLPQSALLEVCCAEHQTQGRGRFGRHWHSPFGENIYCSTRWNLKSSLAQLSGGISLVVGLAMRAMLNELWDAILLQSPIKLKWPNDILWQNKKLGGILIETLHETQIIIGIGLNVNSDTQNHPLPDKPWCSLYEIHQQQFDRNVLITHLLIYLENYLNQFLQKGFSHFLDEWHQSDDLLGKPLTLNTGSKTISGIVRGVNHQGELILEHEGSLHYFSSGVTIQTY
jgi:BirA family biotin operon repressor/biotin-[acetyl-CoA-carboxylase] ligase